MTAIVCKNLLDVSRLTSAFSSHGATATYSSLAQAEKNLDSDDVFFVDYYLASSDDDLALISSWTQNGKKVFVFGSHEKMREIASRYPDVTFLARSIFFRDPTKFL